MGVDQQAYREKVSKVKQFEDYTLGFGINNRITGEIIGTASLWAE